MLAAPDLHPDDLTARIALRDRLLWERQQRGFTLYSFETATGTSSGMLRNREIDPMASYQLGSIVDWANLLGQSFTITAADVPEYRDNPIAAALEFCGADLFQHAAEIDRLITARTAQLSSRKMADRLGVAQTAVIGIEHRDPATALLMTWQRYTRALGGRLDLVLTDGVTGDVWHAHRAQALAGHA